MPGGPCSTNSATSTDPYVAERTGRACLLRPAPEDELRRIVALAERAWGVDRPKYPGILTRYFQFVQGLAEYRQGRSGPGDRR